jgi:tetratricopeptide (TPR) repeat protein
MEPQNQPMNTSSWTTTAELKNSVNRALELLSANEPRQARRQAEETLRRYPREINSMYVVAAAIRAEGDDDEAILRLKALVKRAPDFALAHQELGFALSATGKLIPAIATLQRAVAIEPKLPASWKLMGELFLIDGDENSAAEAFNQHLLASSEDPRLIRAIRSFNAGKTGQAEQLCRAYLNDNPADVTAIRLLAEIGLKVGVLVDSEHLLERCLELAPDFDMARLSYAKVLSRREKLELALDQASFLLEKEPDKAAYLALRASILVRMGDFENAISCYELILERYPAQPSITLSYGHALKTVGEQDKAVDAYRKTIELRPSFGDAWWSLANLKTFRFKDEELEAMRQQQQNHKGSREDFYHLCFALGKALDDRQQYDESFKFYHLGNTIKEKLSGYKADNIENFVARMKTACPPELFTAGEGMGCQANDPIFIVGLPRSGSTLLEQILASHSMVEGTKELIQILAIARRLGGNRKKSETSMYPDNLSGLDSERLRELGQEYIDRTRIQRGKSPFFIDKMPNNFLHIGLISLILPRARIIDARRHPMAACFSGFTQLFARGQSFTYGLNNIGRYYRDYVDLMDHWDEVLPGKVLRVQYEDMVTDTENQVRKMLDHCGLEFEQNCLQFHKTERAVRTASSEQVRQPIYSGALEHWRNFEPHLDELKKALGPVLDRYPINPAKA